MKKSLIALAALATVATAAQAQSSSVTMYGIMDAGYTRMNAVTAGGGAVTGITSGGLSTSRLGFRGAEDLGGGMKANFNLETEILPDTGAQGASTAVLFERAAWVGMSSDAGSVRLGRMNYNEYDNGAAFDTFGGNNLGGWIATGEYGNARMNNGIEVATPTFMGLTANYQHSFGEEAGNATAGKGRSFGLKYSAGKLSAAASSTTTYQATASGKVAGQKLKQVDGVYAKYDAGVVRLHAGYVHINTYNTANTNGVKSGNQDGSFVGVQVPMGNTTFLAQFASFNEKVNNRKPEVYALGATYSLSKRTTAYALFAHSTQDNGSSVSIANSAKYANFVEGDNAVNQTGYSIGIRHTF